MTKSVQLCSAYPLLSGWNAFAVLYGVPCWRTLGVTVLRPGRMDFHGGNNMITTIRQYICEIPYQLIPIAHLPNWSWQMPEKYLESSVAIGICMSLPPWEWYKSHRFTLWRDLRCHCCLDVLINLLWCLFRCVPLGEICGVNFGTLACSVQLGRTSRLSTYRPTGGGRFFISIRGHPMASHDLTTQGTALLVRRAEPFSQWMWRWTAHT